MYLLGRLLLAIFREMIAFSGSFRTVSRPIQHPKLLRNESQSRSLPLTVKAGCTAVKIYRELKSSGHYYRVVYHLGASAGGSTLATSRDRFTYGRAIDASRPTGVALDTAATEYAEAANITRRAFTDRGG